MQPSAEWMERIGREWDENLTRMKVERLVDISAYNIPAGRIFPEHSKGRWSDSIPS